MSSDDGSTDGLDRRTFLQGSALLAGGALAGAASDGAAAATLRDRVDGRYFNWRAREAAAVWERGYRGRPDRTVALTDSGVEARHPDLGPWNGVRATIRDGELVIPASERDRVAVDDEGETFSGGVGPGTFANPDRATHRFETPNGVENVDATMTWSPENVQGEGEDLELYLERLVDGEWERVAASTTGSQPERIDHFVAGGETYRFVVETWLNATADYEITASYYRKTGTFRAADPSVVFADAGSGADDAKTVGWFDAGPRYGSYDQPRDPNGHGTHCASIMSGTGRASAVDAADVVTERPGEVLTLGDTRQYDLDAEAGTGVYGSAYGTGIELVVEGPDGRTLDSTAVSSDSDVQANAVVEAPVERDGTYTVIARAAGGELASTAKLDAIQVGTVADPETTNGDRTGEPTGLHTGVAPDASLVGLQGLSGPTSQLAANAEQFADLFNMRAVNMSWGYVGGLPLGSVGGILDSVPAGIKDIAEAGVLTCAAAGNAATPANGNGSPAVADECISVTATGPLDGLAAYSSGGVGGVDEDDGGVYMKPDVSAPGGVLDDVVDAADTGDPDAPEDEQPAIRGYTGKAGTSMATPFTTGVAGLVAQAMEEDAPSDVALPHPEDTGIEDVYRLKQVLLATASETAFTAAPYHRAHAPTYDFGGRDPYEGYGRVNPGAAVDAVTRELSGTTGDSVGLNLPADERAVAGYVRAGPGTVNVSVSFSHYGGGNAGATKGAPHVDLFVYDGADPAANGEPNVLARAQGLQGEASTSVSLPRDADERTLYVVAKLVNAPGVVNGFDVQAHLDLAVDVEAGFFVDGTRDDDGSAFTGGQTNRVDLTVDPSEPSVVRDVVPSDWDILTEYSDDVDRVERRDGATYVYFAEEAAADEEASYTYFAEAPSGLETSNTYTFGPVEVAPSGDRGWVAVAGTSDTNVVVGSET